MDERVDEKILLIHDNAGEFLYQDYAGLGITDVRIRVLSEYIDYYNTMRPHQGIMQDVPKGYIPQKEQGRIVRKPVLSGL